MRTLITTLLLTASMMASAQTNYDDPTRWAVDAQFGGAIPLIGHNDLTGPGYFTGSTKGRHGTVNKLHAELYMPNTHFSVKGGYEHERLSILSGDAETELKEMMLGGRWYPAPWIWNVQPFVGLDGYLNISSLNNHYSISSSEGYQRTTDIHQPRFSVAPVIGMDIFVFSHIAIQMEYGFRVGVGSHMTATSTFQRMPGETFVTKSDLHRHCFSIGLKVTFPFKFTSDDGRSFFETLLEDLFGND